MAGIYVHIPFCATRCSYCDFHSSTLHGLRDEYVGALCCEAQLRSAELDPEPIRTLYIGGGTPSLLSVEALDRLLEGLAQNFDLTAVQEVTLEANPDDVTEKFLAHLQHTCVNRLSLGVQSFNDVELRAVRRRHTAARAVEAIALARRYGFENISIDLMIGLPQQSREAFEHSVEVAVAQRVEHLSVYMLTCEENTLLHRQVAVGEVSLCSDDELLHRYSYAKRRFAEAGYEHYEISNYAKPGCESHHNSSYWERTPYIGLGSGAHSYDGRRRSWNVADIKQYCEAVRSSRLCYEEEILTADDHYNEAIMLALRTSKGISIDAIDSAYLPHLQHSVVPFISRGLVVEQNGSYRLTEQGIYLSDSIIADLMV